MNRSRLTGMGLSLFGAFCVVYFGGAWAFMTPSPSAHYSQVSTIGGTGTGPASTNFVLHFVKSGTSIQQVAGTSGVAVPPADGNWNANLVPPTGAPYSGLWPVGTANCSIYEGTTFKELQIIIIDSSP